MVKQSYEVLMHPEEELFKGDRIMCINSDDCKRVFKALQRRSVKGIVKDRVLNIIEILEDEE